MDLPQGEPLDGDDYAELRNLYAAYNLSSDNGPASTFARCFTERGVLNLAFADQLMTGRGELEAYKQRDLDARASSGEIRRHINESMYAVRTATGEVEVACYYYLLVGSRTSDDPPARLDAGHYRDVVVSDGGSMRFARRDVNRDLTIPLT